MTNSVDLRALSVEELEAKLAELREERFRLRFRAATEGTPPWQPLGETVQQPKPTYTWSGSGPEPKKWTAPDGTVVYRSYGDYCDD